jgi:hypothetical protein
MIHGEPGQKVRARDGRIGSPCRAFIQKQEDNGGGKIAMIFGQHLANLITAAKLQWSLQSQRDG